MDTLLSNHHYKTGNYHANTKPPCHVLPINSSASPEATLWTWTGCHLLAVYGLYNEYDGCCRREEEEGVIHNAVGLRYSSAVLEKQQQDVIVRHLNPGEADLVVHSVLAEGHPSRAPPLA